MTKQELKEKTNGVVLDVLITEKGSRFSAEMVEKAFGVHVLKVRTANMKGGMRYVRGTRRAVAEPTWKKAIVTVRAGERIELA